MNTSVYQKNTINNCIEENEHNNKKICDKVEKELNIVKEKNIYLTKEYEALLSQPDNTKKVSHIIYKRIKKFLLSLPINIESDLNNVNFYKIINSKGPIVFINGYKYNKVLYIMKILEKLLLYYISLKAQVMNSNSSKSYIAIENKVLKAKKIEKNKQYKEHEVLQIIERNKKIIENL